MTCVIVEVVLDTPFGRLEPGIAGAFFGAILGGALGVLGTLLASHRERAHQDRIRLVPQKASAYEEVIENTDAALLPLRAIYADRDTVPDAFDLVRLLTTYGKAEVVAAPFVRMSLLHLQSQMMLIEIAVTGAASEQRWQEYVKTDAYQGALHSVWTSRVQFLGAARRDLGVQGWPYDKVMDKDLEDTLSTITAMFPDPEPAEPGANIDAPRTDA